MQPYFVILWGKCPDHKSLTSGDGWESWKTDRPMRKEGFNIKVERVKKS